VFYRGLIIFFILLFSKLAIAHQFQKNHININHPHIKFVSSSDSAAGYMKIVNMGFETDRLLRVLTNFADTELLDSQINDGTVTTKKVDFIEIPPQKAKPLKPGTHHIMLSNFSIEFIEGMSLEGYLVFEKAGEIRVLFETEIKKSINDHTEH
tara:strand:+ start:185 stop:643 length:459 start_codon:yes stop_codon:yes gene_type:complete